MALRLWRARKLALAVFAFSAPLSLVLGATLHDEAFIGWEGESYKPMQPHTKPDPNNPNAPWVELVSWKPRAFIYHNFMTAEEAIHIRKVAAPTMRRSTVVGAGGRSVLDDYRTSYGTFIRRKHDHVIEAVENRVAAWARIPPIHAEDMQVLRYSVNQSYKPHMDTLADEVAGPRVATVLLYLNDVEAGGETAFTENPEWSHPGHKERYDPQFSDCAKDRVGFKPKMGDALMFWSIHPDGKSVDHHSSHTGCPVVKGVKWTATKWVHARPFRPETFDTPEVGDPDPGKCEDVEASCEKWARAGECENNAGFMVGDVGSAGKCRRACKACTPCAPDDRKCYAENRQKAGFLSLEEMEQL